MTYQQLTLDERYQIQVLLKCRLTPSAIAKQLGRHRATLYRELLRNGEAEAAVPYLAARAQRKTRTRRIVKGQASRKIRGQLQRLVEQKLRLSWSPEQISGRLRMERGIRISHETIYQHVLRDTHLHQGFLRYCLRFGGYKHHRFKKCRAAIRTRLRKNWLDTRPAAANERREIGHWERDCVLGTRGASALLTIVDRCSRFTRIRHVRKVNVNHVADATLKALGEHREVTKTITNDNGIEFQRDESLQSRLGIKIYFTEPSSPWQRGTVENANGLVRQYVPKHTNMDRLPHWVPTALEDTLNHRPRKILGFKTPHEVFFGASLKLTSARWMRFGLEFSSPT
jgi:transposase, IS30 family